MRLILITILSFFILSSCLEEDSSSTDSVKTLKIENLINSKVAYEKDGKISLGVKDSDLMKAFQDFVFISDLKLKPESFELLSIDNMNYLRFYSDNHKASTIELIKSDDGFYFTGNTVCTSSACSSCCGCVPNGLYCTECKPYGPDSPLKGDCTRTTSEIEPGDV